MNVKTKIAIIIVLIILSTGISSILYNIIETRNNPINRAPVISNLPDQTVYKGFPLLDAFDLDNYTRANIQSLVISGNNFFAGARRTGIWRRPLSEMITGIDKSNDNIPAAFSLEQNYPNPFNPSTKIKYSIPSVETHGHASVQLVVYDILGREITTLVNKEQAPGRYEVTFNASQFASETYIYRIVAGEFVSIKKMLLIK